MLEWNPLDFNTSVGGSLRKWIWEVVVLSWLLYLRVGGMGGVYIAITKNLTVRHLYAQLGVTG
jgi:hypothetical protein